MYNANYFTISLYHHKKPNIFYIDFVCEIKFRKFKHGLEILRHAAMLYKQNWIKMQNHRQQRHINMHGMHNSKEKMGTCWVFIDKENFIN